VALGGDSDGLLVTLLSIDVANPREDGEVRFGPGRLLVKCSNLAGCESTIIGEVIFSDREVCWVGETVDVGLCISFAFRVIMLWLTRPVGEASLAEDIVPETLGEGSLLVAILITRAAPVVRVEGACVGGHFFAVLTVGGASTVAMLLPTAVRRF